MKALQLTVYYYYRVDTSIGPWDLTFDPALSGRWQAVMMKFYDGVMINDGASVLLLQGIIVPPMK